MDPTELTITILKEIRDEIRSTNSRLDQTNSRLDQTNSRLDHVETALVELAQQQRFVVRYVKVLAERDGAVVEDLEQVKKRLELVEDKLGIPR